MSVIVVVCHWDVTRDIEPWDPSLEPLDCQTCIFRGQTELLRISRVSPNRQVVLVSGSYSSRPNPLSRFSRKWCGAPADAAPICLIAAAMRPCPCASGHQGVTNVVAFVDLFDVVGAVDLYLHGTGVANENPMTEGIRRVAGHGS